MDFSDSESDTGSKDWDRLHDAKMKKLDQQKRNWGKNRENYYNSDTQYFDVQKDEDAVKAEEREIKMIQQEQAALLGKMDFGLESLLGGLKPGASKTATKASTTKTKTTTKDGKGKSVLSVEERVRQVLSTSPELLAFLSQYLTYSQELTATIPLISTNLSQVKDIIDISPIVSLIKLRQQLLLAFCNCILYYLYLKSMTKSTADHPVMSKLLGLQTLIDAQNEEFDEIKSTLIDIQVKFVLPTEEYNTEMAKRSARDMERAAAMGMGGDDSDDVFGNESAADYYNRHSKHAKAQKSAREELHQARNIKRVKLGSNIIDEGIRRGIGSKIEQNVGLKRQKSRKQRKHGTTRGKLRKKSDLALSKRKSTIRGYKGQQGTEYTGEATIKQGLIRSINLG